MKKAAIIFAILTFCAIVPLIIITSSDPHPNVVLVVLFSCLSFLFFLGCMISLLIIQYKKISPIIKMQKEENQAILSSIDEKRFSDLGRKRNAFVISMDGWSGSIYVYEDKIEINSKTFRMNEITNIFVSPSTVMSRGFLQVILQGDTPSTSIEAALKAPNTVLLQALGQNDAALTIKQCVAKLKTMDIKIQKKRIEAIIGKYSAENVNKAGAALTSTGIIYDILDSVSTYETWSVEDTKFISYEDIDFFSSKGSLRQETTTQGGGLNLEGAVIGGLLFGGVGALLGGKLGTDTYSTTKNVDDRFIFARSSKSSYDIILALGEEVDDTMIKLRKIMPEKEYSSEQGFKKESHTTESDSKITTTLSNELKTLKDLLDDGIITQEDFDAKKKQLLGL